MQTKLTLADYAFEPWKHELDNRIFDSFGDSIFDHEVTESEMGESFDADLPLWRAAIELVVQTPDRKAHVPMVEAFAPMDA